MIVLPLPPVESAPKLVLVRWRAWEVQVPSYDAPSWHLVGYLSEDFCVKVSSAIAEVSAAGDDARSKTGSRYALGNPPGVDADAARLWTAWQRQHGVVVLREVTSEVQAGRQPRPVHLIRRPGAGQPDIAPASSLRGHREW